MKCEVASGDVGVVSEIILNCHCPLIPLSPCPLVPLSPCRVLPQLPGAPNPPAAPNPSFDPRIRALPVASSWILH